MRTLRLVLPLVLAALGLAVLGLPAATAHAAAPSMTVWDFTGTTIGAGETFAMGTTTVGHPFKHYFVVAGSYPDPLENVDVTVPAGFEIVSAPPSTIQPGAAHGTMVRCLAQSPGTYSGQVVITSNAANSPYAFTISCTVDAQSVDPDIRLVIDPNTALPAGGTVDLGTTDPNVNAVRSVRVYNDGAGPLVLDAVQFSDPMFTSPGYVPDTTGAAFGYHVYFNVRCKSATPGLHTATATVPSNDPDTPDYSFTVTCTVKGAVEGPGDPVDEPDDPAVGGDNQAPQLDRGDLPRTGMTSTLATTGIALVGAGLVLRRASRRTA
jgi:hypothetical protein